MNSSYGKVMLDIKSTNLSDQDKILISNKHVGGLILFSRNFKSYDQLRKLTQQIKSIKQFSNDNPAFPEGGVRHAIFFKGDALEKHGALIRFGRKILINEELWFELTKDGFFKEISGGHK